MNLYLISQKVNNEYDTYDSAVVCAKDAEQARRMHPQDWHEITDWPDYDGSWVHSVDDVSARLIGVASEDCAAGLVLASFHAG
jgi:hypothetical protein